MSVFKPAVGDRVTYSARFLASIGGGLETGFEGREGSVVAILPSAGKGPDRIRVQWDDEPDEPTSALAVNLARAKSWRALDPTATR